MAGGVAGGGARSGASKKRYSATSIMDFFQRKRPQGARVVIDEEDEVEDRRTVETIDSGHERAPQLAPSADNAIESISSEDETDVSATSATVDSGGEQRETARKHRDDAESVAQLVYRRQLGECGGRAPRKIVNPRQRLADLTARWALGSFQSSPVKLTLPADWEQRAGRLRTEEFYASCLEFDSAGVLLAAGSSSGIIAIYDFDEYAHRTINAGHIHTIFTLFEVQAIRWNPMNEDEIACSFSNRNEIWLFNLRKFPTKPNRVLKSSSHTSSGYNSFVFVTKKPRPSPAVPSIRKGPQKAETELCYVVAGDTVGAIRMWDVRFPTRPVWSLSTGSHPVNSIILSRCKQEVICGTQSGVVVVYEVHNVSVRAIGSKPTPLRKAVLSVAEAIKPHAVHDLTLMQSVTQLVGASGVVSLRLVPQSASRVLCQLRNDWLVVVDLATSAVIRLYSRKIEFGRSHDPRDSRPKAMSVLTAPRDLELPIATMRTNPNSWLGCHRCPSTLLFDSSVACWSPHGRLSLDTVSLVERSSTLVERAKAATPEKDANAEVAADKDKPRDVPAGWLRLPTSGPVTAVTSHPTQHLVVCGGANMELLVLGSYGRRAEPAEHQQLRSATSLYC